MQGPPSPTFGTEPLLGTILDVWNSSDETSLVFDAESCCPKERLA